MSLTPELTTLLARSFITDLCWEHQHRSASEETENNSPEKGLSKIEAETRVLTSPSIDLSRPFNDFALLLCIGSSLCHPFLAPQIQKRALVGPSKDAGLVSTPFSRVAPWCSRLEPSLSKKAPRVKCPSLHCHSKLMVRHIRPKA
eukprot:2457625-Amphidinium_carterae.1